MPSGYFKKRNNEEPDKPEPEQELPISLTKEEIEELSWLIKQLVEDGGFDTYWAGAIASIGSVDYREACALKRRGCPQQLVYELLS